MISFSNIHHRAHAAGCAAPLDMNAKGYSIIVLPPGDNFTRWAKREGFDAIRPTHYARAYVKVLQANGIMAKLDTPREPPPGHRRDNDGCPLNADARNECCACIAPWLDRQFRISDGRLEPSTTGGEERA